MKSPVLASWFALISKYSIAFISSLTSTILPIAFILFMEYKDSVEPQIKRIYERLTKKYKDFDIGVSMGIACAEKNMDYDTLFTMADTAMYNVTRRVL